MRRAPAFPVLALATVGLFGVTAAPAHADERVCRGVLGAVTVDDLRVPSGATCTLRGTQVEGTLQVESRATLTATSVRVDGNVQGEGSAMVTVTDSRIGGSVQLTQGGGATVLRNRVGGDVQYDAMTRPLRTDGNVVGGNVQIVGNVGGVTVHGNRIDGALQCKENSPAPTGSGNTASSLEGQCSRLTVPAGGTRDVTIGIRQAAGTYTFTGTISPAQAGVQVTTARLDSVTKRVTGVASTRTDAAGRYTIRTRLPVGFAGYYSLTEPRSGTSAGRSRLYGLVVPR
jgi:hypothetical protein